MTPFQVTGDAYTVAAPLVSPKAREKSVYNMTFRRSPKDAFNFGVNNKIQFYGLSDYLEQNLVSGAEPYLTYEIADFMRRSHAFGPSFRMDFDQDAWQKALTKYRGCLPIVIEALPEGSSFFPNQPIVQVRSIDEGFGEMAAFIEAVLVGQVSIASTALTARRHLLAKMEEYVREDNPDLTPEEIRFKASLMIHDFGMRSHSSRYESEMLGRTHLLVFPGTDTFNAAYSAWVKGGKDKVFGTSIPALAHRTVQSWDKQIDAFREICSQAQEGGIVSIVCDCYNFDKTIETGGDYDVVSQEFSSLTTVARPDSGDYVDTVLKIVNQAKDQGYFTTQPNGRIAMTKRRFIQGDAMTWDKMQTVMDALKMNGFSPVNCGIFGVGGWLRNIATRDALSVAYKLAAIGKDNQPVVKLSEIPEKMSIPGPTVVVDGNPSVRFEHEQGDHALPNRLKVWYHGEFGGVSKMWMNENFGTTKERCLNEFGTLSEPKELLSQDISTIRNLTFNKHRA